MFVFVYRWYKCEKKNKKKIDRTYIVWRHRLHNRRATANSDNTRSTFRINEVST